MPPARSTTGLKMRSFLSNAMNDLSFAVQKRMRLGDIIDVGRRGEDRTDDTHFDAESNVRRHSEGPLAPLIRVVHVWFELHFSFFTDGAAAMIVASKTVFSLSNNSRSAGVR